MLSYLRILFFPALSILISSCTGNSKDKEVINILNESLKKSSTNASQNIYFIQNSLTKKSTHPATAEKALYWMPKAEDIIENSVKIFTWIDSLKTNPELVDSYTNELLNKLRNYKAVILNIDGLIESQFENDLTLLSISMDTLLYNQNNKLSRFIKSLSRESAIAFLTAVQANILNTESKMVTFCNEQVGSPDGFIFWDYYSPLVGQSSKMVNTGGGN